MSGAPGEEGDSGVKGTKVSAVELKGNAKVFRMGLNDMTRTPHFKG